jgi:hypothetical protein
LSDSWKNEVRVLYGDPGNPVTQAQRTPAQKHTESALSTALELQADALTAVRASLEWLRSVGADVPSRYRNLPTLVRQLGQFIEDEQGRRK